MFSLAGSQSMYSEVSTLGQDLHEDSIMSQKTHESKTAEELEEDWILQMKQMEELEELGNQAKEYCASSSLCLQTLLPLIESFPGLQRVSIYEYMEACLWKIPYLEVLTETLIRIPHDHILNTMEFLLQVYQQYHLIQTNNSGYLHIITLYFFHDLETNYILEFLYQISLHHRMHFLEYLRHFPPLTMKYIHPFEDIQVTLDQSKALYRDLLDYIHAYHNIHEIITMLFQIETQSEKKHCSVCRLKRSYAFGFRMRTDQLPGQLLPVPGTMPIYDKSQTWAAAEDLGYTFDYREIPNQPGQYHGQIYYSVERLPINLIELCETCLQDVNLSISNRFRHEPYHHLDPIQRIEFLKWLRYEESKLSFIIGLIARERLNRRLRDFVLQAIKHHRQQLAYELKEEENKQMLLQKQQKIDKKKLEKQYLIESAMKSDARWLAFNHMTDLKYLTIRQKYSLIQNHLGFTLKNLPPKLRKHSKTWRLMDFDREGIPLNSKASNNLFGTAIIEEPEYENYEKPLIDIWKTIAEEKFYAYQAKLELKQKLNREQQLYEYHTLIHFVHENNLKLSRQQMVMKNIYQQIYLSNAKDLRLYHKEIKKNERFLQYLAQENAIMEQEDYRSYQLREYHKELERETFEQELMLHEEQNQCEVDRFWGIDLFQKLLEQEEKRLLSDYLQYVKYLNQLMFRCQLISQRTENIRFTIEDMKLVADDTIIWDEDSEDDEDYIEDDNEDNNNNYNEMKNKEMKEKDEKNRIQQMLAEVRLSEQSINDSSMINVREGMQVIHGKIITPKAIAEIEQEEDDDDDDDDEINYNLHQVAKKQQQEQSSETKVTSSQFTFKQSSLSNILTNNNHPISSSKVSSSSKIPTTILSSNDSITSEATMITMSSTATMAKKVKHPLDSLTRYRRKLLHEFQRLAFIKFLKAEEFRHKLKIRMKTKFY